MQSKASKHAPTSHMILTQAIESLNVVLPKIAQDEFQENCAKIESALIVTVNTNKTLTKNVKSHSKKKKKGTKKKPGPTALSPTKLAKPKITIQNHQTQPSQTELTDRGLHIEINSEISGHKPFGSPKSTTHKKWDNLSIGTENAGGKSRLETLNEIMSRIAPKVPQNPSQDPELSSYSANSKKSLRIPQITDHRFYKTYFSVKLNKPLCTEVEAFEIFRKEEYPVDPQQFFNYKNTPELTDLIQHSMEEKDKLIDLQQQLLNFNQEVDRIFRLVRKQLKSIDSQIHSIFDRLDVYIKGAFKQLIIAKKRAKDERIERIMGAGDGGPGGAGGVWGDLREGFTVDDGALIEVLLKKQYKNWETPLGKGGEFVPSLEKTVGAVVGKKFYPVYQNKLNGEEWNM